MGAKKIETGSGTADSAQAAQIKDLDRGSPATREVRVAGAVDQQIADKKARLAARRYISTTRLV